MRFLFLALAVLLAGCATPYKPDLAGKPTARVRLVSDYSLLTQAGVLTGECVPLPQVGWNSANQFLGHAMKYDGVNSMLGKAKSQVIGMPSPPDTNEYWFTIGGCGVRIQKIVAQGGASARVPVPDARPIRRC